MFPLRASAILLLTCGLAAVAAAAPAPLEPEGSARVVQRVRGADWPAVDLTVLADRTAAAGGSAGVRAWQRGQQEPYLSISESDLAGPALSVALSGADLYVGAGRSLILVEAGAEAVPRSLAVGGAVRRLVVAEGRVVAAAGVAGLLVVDAEAVDPLAGVAVVTTAYPAWDVAVSPCGQVAWVAGAGGVELVDLTGDTPVLLGLLRTRTPAQAVTAAAGHLWVALDDGLLLTCDAADPRRPAVLRQERFPSPVVRMDVHRGRFHALGADGRLRDADVLGGGRLALRGATPASAPVRSFAATSDGLLIGAVAGGLVLHRSPSVPAAPLRAPASTRLMGALPNSFDTGATVLYRLARPGRVRLSVHDAVGRETALLLDGHREAGAHSQAWDGVLADGGGRWPGIWYVRLEAGGAVDTRVLQ